MLKSTIFNYFVRNISSEKVCNHASKNTFFETVFTLPQIKYIAIINRLKVYHFFGTGIAIPCSALLELCNVIPNNVFLTTSYIGITGAAVFSMASIPFRNTIGFIYVSKDNKLIKISSLDFWGKRKDRIVDTNDWIPLLLMSPKIMDAIYLTPQLTDGTKYKLIVKYGKIVNATKMSQVLE